MKNEKAELLLKSSKYKFATTMLKSPHFYTLKETWENSSDFTDAVQFIRDHGEAEYFYGKTYIYYYMDGHKYWTMGSALDKTILINRAKS